MPTDINRELPLSNGHKIPVIGLGTWQVRVFCIHKYVAISKKTGPRKVIVVQRKQIQPFCTFRSDKKLFESGQLGGYWEMYCKYSKMRPKDLCSRLLRITILPVQIQGKSFTAEVKYLQQTTVILWSHPFNPTSLQCSINHKEMAWATKPTTVFYFENSKLYPLGGAWKFPHLRHYLYPVSGLVTEHLLRKRIEKFHRVLSYFHTGNPYLHFFSLIWAVFLSMSTFETKERSRLVHLVFRKSQKKMFFVELQQNALKSDTFVTSIFTENPFYHFKIYVSMETIFPPTRVRAIFQFHVRFRIKKPKSTIYKKLCLLRRLGFFWMFLNIHPMKGSEFQHAQSSAEDTTDFPHFYYGTLVQ